ANCQMAMGLSVVRVGSNRPLKTVPGCCDAFQCLFPVVPKALEHQFVTGDVLIGHSARPVSDFDLDPANQRVCNDAGNFVLQGKDIREGAVVMICPAGGATCRLGEPGRNSYPVVRFADAS